MISNRKKGQETKKVQQPNMGTHKKHQEKEKKLLHKKNTCSKRKRKETAVMPAYIIPIHPQTASHHIGKSTRFGSSTWKIKGKRTVLVWCPLLYRMYGMV